MSRDLAEAARPALEPSLAPGEELLGIVAATHQRTFSGTLYAIGVTPDRLILQPLDRHFAAKDAPLIVTPGELAAAELDGAGGDWWSAGSAVLDTTAVAVTLKLAGGDKLKLRMMKGGDGLLGSLGGGESQRTGVQALVEWMQRHLSH